MGDMGQVESFGVEFDDVVEAVHSVTFPQTLLDDDEMRVVSATGDVLGRRQPAESRGSGDVTVTRGVHRSEGFSEWIAASLGKRGAEGSCRDITLVGYDATGRPVARYHLKNAWVSHLAVPGADAGGESQEGSVVTLTYEEATVRRP
ncbi:phage tail protein [Streptomyces sp. NPDC048603]|uniref:phage tail protein n=1 Tax=Streptomyces sp. NPDC048603 TaxID=3365577 RepID=UPI00371E600C